jgi:aarF domain-containing kinase
VQLFQKWLRPQVVLLDVGMATELSGDDRNNMLALFQGFSDLDGAAMAEATLRFAGEAQRCLNPDGFRQAIAKCVPPSAYHVFSRCKCSNRDQCWGGCRSMDAMKVDSWGDTEFTSPAAAFASVLEIVREYEVTLPGHICAVLVTVLVLEGWSSALKPDHSVMSEVKNIVSMDTQSWKQRLNACVEEWMEWSPVLPSLDAC